jgi:hypothetical protein
MAQRTLITCIQHQLYKLYGTDAVVISSESNPRQRNRWLLIICGFLQITANIALFDKHITPKLYLQASNTSRCHRIYRIMVFTLLLPNLLLLRTRLCGFEACNR